MCACECVCNLFLQHRLVILVICCLQLLPSYIHTFIFGMGSNGLLRAHREEDDKDIRCVVWWALVVVVVVVCDEIMM